MFIFLLCFRIAMNKDKDELTRVLVDELGFTPYEARAYVAILVEGPLSPKGLNQKSGIPRPRTYDVLNGLVGKGLLLEQPGKPTLYTAVDPKIGLKKLMESIEKRVESEIKTGWRAVDSLTSSLSKFYKKGLREEYEEDRIWVTRRDFAMIAKYTEAIKGVKKQIVIASAASGPPEKEILDAVKSVLARKKTVRVIRAITTEWSKRDLEEYEGLIGLGSQIRHLKHKGLTFAIFDAKTVVLWLPPYPSQTTVWLELPSLADVLLNRFEDLWQSAEPAMPIIKKLLASK
jgi:sugar-specific transcriptional regulator TrmB